MDCNKEAKAIYKGRIVFLTNEARTMSIHKQKNLLFDPYILPYNKMKLYHRSKCKT